MRFNDIDPLDFVAQPIATPFPLFALLSGLQLSEGFELSPGISLRPIEARVFSHPMLSIGPAESGRPSPGPWVQVAGAPNHFECRAQLAFVEDASPLYPRSPRAIQIAVAAIRLSVDALCRCVVAAGRPFSDESMADGLRPVAVELHYPQSGPASLGRATISELERNRLRDIALPIASAFQDQRFYRAYQIFDQAQWTTSPDAAMALIWASIEHLLEVGAEQGKGKAMAHAIAKQLHPSDKSKYDRCVADVLQLYKERGRFVHGGHLAEPGLVGRSFHYARFLLWARAHEFEGGAQIDPVAI